MAAVNQTLATGRKRIERMPSVLDRTGLSESEVRRRMKANTFPQPVKLGPRAIGFISSEIDAWIDSLTSGGVQ